MNTLTRRITQAALAIVSGGVALMASAVPFTAPEGFVTTAQARIGRPLTPLSYAGVARRTTRRAYAAGAAVAVGAAAATRCVQVVDAYGRIITRCY
jgi:hypothetical protein